MAVRRILQTASWIALAGIVVPPALFLMGRMDLSNVKTWMLAATIAWFVVTPLWMGRETEEIAS